MAMGLSLLVHGILYGIFLFIVAWREPYPPLEEYGIELNFGTDEAGTGEVQPETTPEESDSDEQPATEAAQAGQEESVEDVPAEDVMAPAEAMTEETTDNTQESPDVMEQQPEEVPDEAEPVVAEESAPREIEPAAEVVTVPQEETEQPADGADGDDGAADVSPQANQGDNAQEVGDKGDEEGTLDARALYGKPGGGDGSALEMTGWMWDSKPKPVDSSSESGRIVFEVKIDDQGEILAVRTLERSVSPAVEKIYRSEVEKLTFSKTSDNSLVAAVSTGKITFVIKSK